MGIPYIMGFEGDLPLGVYKDSDWVLWCAPWNDGDLGAHAVNAEVDIDPGHNEPGEINDAIPIGGGQKSLKMTAGVGTYRELFSPANLLDITPAGSGAGSSAATNGKGLKQVGVRFFWKVPSVREYPGTPMGIRFWDGNLGRQYQDTNGTKINPFSSPLFTIAFNDQGSGGSGFGFEIREGSGGGANPPVLESSSTTPLHPGKWCQVAMRVGLDDNDGFVYIYIDGVIALQYDGALQFIDPGGEDPDPVQGIEYFSFPHCNADHGGGVFQSWDNFVVRDYWNSATNSIMDETADLIVQNQVIHGLFPQEEGGSVHVNWTTNEENFHEAIQGIDNDSTGVIDNIPYSQTGNSVATTTTMPSSYEVDMWNADRVITGGDWAGNIGGGGPLAIRVVAVAKGDGADAQVSLNAPPGVGAPTGTNLGPTYTLSNEFSIVQKTWDRNPDGDGVGTPDSFNMASVNLLRVGLKVDSD